MILKKKKNQTLESIFFTSPNTQVLRLVGNEATNYYLKATCFNIYFSNSNEI